MQLKSYFFNIIKSVFQMKKILFSNLIVLLFAITATAQTTKADVDTRQQNQKARIKDGVKSGELTKAEAEKARAQQAQIRRAEAKAKSDGTVTAEERAKLDAKQDKASKRIYKNKHDAQQRN
jgi:ABC-type Na+ efflux pump permease subunit